MAFMDDLDRGLSSKGGIRDKFANVAKADTPDTVDEKPAEPISFDDSSERKRHLEEASSSGFDLASFMTFDISRGAEDSAPASKLGFTVETTGIENSVLGFKFVFDDPESVSIGE